MSKAEWREGLSSEERERAIESILDEALPACETARGRMRGNLAALPLRVLFFGIEDCAILAAMVAVAGAIPLAFMVEPEHAVHAVFMLSPVLFAALQGLVAWKDRESGTIAWRAACRMTVLELHAARMLLFGALGVLFTVPLAAAAWAAIESAVSFWWMLSLAMASLAVFGVFALLIARFAVSGRKRETAPAPIAATAPLVAWIALGALLSVLPGAAAVVLAVPAVVFFAVAAAAAALFVRLATDMCAVSSVEYA